MLVVLRYIGSVFVIVGYYVLLNVDVYWGIVLRMVANIISLPWAIKHKIWDFVILLSFFLVIEIHKLSLIILN